MDITGAQAFGPKGEMWGLDPAQIPAAKANKSVVSIRITYADGRQETIQVNSLDP